MLARLIIDFRHLLYGLHMSVCISCIFAKYQFLCITFLFRVLTFWFVFPLVLLFMTLALFFELSLLFLYQPPCNFFSLIQDDKDSDSSRETLDDLFPDEQDEPGPGSKYQTVVLSSIFFFKSYFMRSACVISLLDKSAITCKIGRAHV